jgi:Tfp pilus assembly protein PilX
MLNRMNEERGVAMVVALLVAMVVTLISIAVVAQSIHDLDASGSDRRRLLSVNAAEAGTNAWYAHLQTEPVSSPTYCDPLAETIATAPAAASYSAVATFYAADGTTEMTCPFTTTTYPSFAKILSTGTLNTTDRQIETYVRLTPQYGGFSAAILGIDGTTFNNQFNVYGDVGNDGDIYILEGDLNITNALTVNGNIFVPEGGLSMSNNSVIKGNAWARDDVTLENPAVIEGNALSSAGGIFAGATGGEIDGSATAYDDIDDASLTIGGTVSPFTEVGPVPTHTFPQITADTTDWVDAGYSVVTFSDCGLAYDYVRLTGAGTWAGLGYPDTVVRITSSCQFKNGNNDTINVGGNLAIVSDGGFKFDLRSNWNGATTVKKLYFISTYKDPDTCSSPDAKDISVSNNTNFNSYLNVFFYTPCKATMGNTNAFEGQVMASNVEIRNNFKVNYEAVLVPGIADITGFKQDISYVREV